LEGTFRAAADGMRERDEPPGTYAWIVYAVAMLMVGGLGGYVLSISSMPVAVAPAAQSIPAVAQPMVDENELRAYRDILARDPKNVQAAVKGGNLLYDAQRYPEAIAFYQQALALNPRDIDVSTDLGTALWYSGRPDEALAQYERSLAIDPRHAQTLFNVGIVRAEGKRDYAGAIAVWESLLKSSPDYAGARRVQTLIADARRSNPVGR